ncbi:MAG: D-alanine--D-alanine ligase family protein [Pyrinomonadaceae bacterium]
MKTNIGVIFGGRTGEHDISVRSANTVIQNIDTERYEIVPVAISKDGAWLNPFESAALLSDDARSVLSNDFSEFESSQIALTGDTQPKGFVDLKSSAISKLDVVFPILHGTYGEDGTIQGLLEMADIPYIGGGVLASSCGMDKVVMKTLFKEAGLPICKHVWFLRRDWENSSERVIQLVENSIGYPCFVKPANLGSSVGVSRAEDAEALKSSIALAAEYDRKIIVEEALNIREIECAVIGNDEPEASLPGEYLIRDKTKTFLDYTEKYSGTGNNEFVVPAPVSEELSKKIRQMAITAFQAIDGSGLARVDFFLRNDTGTLLVSEINTMPGLTDASGFPKMWAGSGMSFSAVIDRLVELALERHKDKARNKTSLSDK